MMDGVPNEWIQEVSERIDEDVLQWFGHVGRPKKRWICTMKDFTKNKFGCQTSKENNA